MQLDLARPSCWHLCLVRTLFLLVLARPAAVQAQFTYTSDGSSITITAYTGPGGEVTIPGTIDGAPVEAIGNYAFASCSTLTGVTISDSVTTIGDYAFASCPFLTNVAVGSRVANIGSWAFYGCLDLTNLTIPNSVRNVGDSAFNNCINLSTIAIPSSVTNIGTGPFGVCYSLTEITVDPLNPRYISLDGVLFDKSLSALLQCPGAKAGSYIIPDGTGSIADQAFYYCGSLTSVSLPVTLTNIGEEAFYSCIKLTNATIPEEVTMIGRFAYSGCRSLDILTIGDKVAFIGSGAFEYCSALTNVAIPSCVTNIGDAAFVGCSSLTAITVDPSNPSYTSVDGVLFKKTEATLVQFPGGKTGVYTIPDGVVGVGAHAFAFCEPTAVILPKSVTTIGPYAFFICGLASVTIPYGVTSIGTNAFFSSGLTNVAIPDSVTNVDGEAFSSCMSLRSVVIGNGLTRIADRMFQECERLTNVTFLDGVANIGVEAFASCYALRTLTIPFTVTNLSDSAFANCYMSGFFFQGNAPHLGMSVFPVFTAAVVYYLPGTTGWGPTFGGLPTALWVQVPTLVIPPQTQTTEVASTVDFWVNASSPLPLFYFWYFDSTNLLRAGTNSVLELSNVQLAQSGTYSVVVSNVLGAVTSAPVMLSVIVPVERRLVPGIKVAGETASVVNIDYANSLSPAPNWTTLGSFSLSSTSQYWFELTLPLPPQRFYRAWQTGAPDVIASLDAHLVPAITLTGNIGDSLRLDYINQFGPTDAWVSLDTITLTNTSQLYFDTSSIGQPPRLWRMVSVP